LLCLYLATGGGHGYSIDGAFGYEMAKTAFLDPEHTYFHRFKTAFARWGALLPLLGQPFVLTGDLLARFAPERDEVAVDGHHFRIEEWPPLDRGGRSAYAPPLPPGPRRRVEAVGVVSFLANAASVPQGMPVGEVRLWQGDQYVSIPVRAGVQTAEWAHDRPDVLRQMQHERARVAGHWIGQPRGNLYFALLPLGAPLVVDRWELLAGPGLPAGASWNVRAAALKTAESGEWLDVHTGERYWSARETRDFFTRLAYSTLNAFTTAASATLVYLIACRFGYGRAVAALVALGFGAATMAWPYAKLDFSEPASTLFVLAATWTLFRVFPPAGSDRTPQRAPTAVRGNGMPPRLNPSLQAVSVRATPDGMGWRRALAWGVVASACLLLAIAGKYTAALAAAAIAAQWVLSSGWWQRGRRTVALAYGAGLLGPALVLGAAAGAVASAATGELPIVLTSGTGRLAEDWLALPFWIGLRGLLFSPGKSLFLYSPWLLLAVPGTWLFLRRHRRDGVLIAVFPWLIVGLYSMKLVFHGGSWGPRYLVTVVPLLAVAVAPVVDWCLRRGRTARVGLAALTALSIGAQLIGVAKDPERYPSIVREFVVPFLPDHGSAFGGRDYWLARGGDGLARALRDPTTSGKSRGLGYAWGLPDVHVALPVRVSQTFTLSLYFVDWDRQGRRQTVVVDDTAGRRVFELDHDFGSGVWASWLVAAEPDRPVTVSVHQRGADTAVVSAAAFDPPRIARQDAPVLDQRTRGDWLGAYGADGHVLFAFRSFNVDVASPPPYLLPVQITHVGDKPNPRIHVEIAEQDVLDTPLLFAPPFSPLLGNAWLLAADLAHLALPARPGVAAATLARPPWTWFGVSAPALAHPEYGLGLDFWPSLLYSSYASHRALLAAGWVFLGTIEVGLVLAAWRLGAALLGRRAATAVVIALGASVLVFNWLQVQA
jgi:hypothetical protein